MRNSLVLAALFAAVIGGGPSSAGGDHFFLESNDLSDGWESLAEAPDPVIGDADLEAWGVRARETRHYTRYRGRRIEVCSVEVWTFASEAQAHVALEGFSYPDWEIERAGTFLVMLRGRSWTRGESIERRVFAACREIGRRVRLRAARPEAP